MTCSHKIGICLILVKLHESSSFQSLFDENVSSSSDFLIKNTKLSESADIVYIILIGKAFGNEFFTL